MKKQYKAVFAKSQGVLVELHEYGHEWRDNPNKFPEAQEGDGWVYIYFQTGKVLDLEIEMEAIELFQLYMEPENNGTTNLTH